ADGRKYLILHGDEFDVVVRNADITLIEGTRSQGYESILLHKAADRQPGQEGELRDAYGADVTLKPKPNA
ncbi:hypothetical protein ACC718_38925, partial [Rhizobium ruizarguesonis]